VLDAARSSRDGRDFEESLVESLATTFDVRNVTFFFGSTYPTLFEDPEPVLTGSTRTLLRQYQDSWRTKDVFGTPTARRILTVEGFATVDNPARLPAPQRSYVHDYLAPNEIGTASAIHLRLADGEALLGMFDRERTWDRSDIVALKLLAYHLRASSTSVMIGSASAIGNPLDSLSPRQYEVAELIGDGLTNAQIADILVLTEMTIKKYVSRIFEATGLPNRAAVAASITSSRRAR
jgi:DNA-binding CsgD family transcriptional regulator